MARSMGSSQWAFAYLTKSVHSPTTMKHHRASEPLAALSERQATWRCSNRPSLCVPSGPAILTPSGFGPLSNTVRKSGGGWTIFPRARVAGRVPPYSLSSCCSFFNCRVLANRPIRVDRKFGFVPLFSKHHNFYLLSCGAGEADTFPTLVPAGPLLASSWNSLSFSLPTSSLRSSIAVLIPPSGYPRQATAHGAIQSRAKRLRKRSAPA